MIGRPPIVGLGFKRDTADILPDFSLSFAGSDERLQTVGAHWIGTSIISRRLLGFVVTEIYRNVPPQKLLCKDV